EASEAGWDGLRAWLAPGFQITQRAGWQGHRTRLSAPDRAARRGVGLAVAPWGRRSVGGGAGVALATRALPAGRGACSGAARAPRGGGGGPGRRAGGGGAPPAARERVASRVGAAAGGPAAPGSVARGTLGAGPLAHGAAAGGSSQRADRGPGRCRLRREGRA